MTAPPGGTAVTKVPLTCNWKGTVDVSSDGATRNGTTVDSVRFTFTVDANDTHSFLVESLDASGDVIVTTSYAETSHEPCVLESMTRQSGDLTWGANAVMIEEGA